MRVSECAGLQFFLVFFFFFTRENILLYEDVIKAYTCTLWQTNFNLWNMTAKKTNWKLHQTFYILKGIHQTHTGSSCFVSVLSSAELVLSHLPAVVTSVRRFTLLTASDRNSRGRHQSRVAPLKRHPEPSGERSLCRPSLLAELSNLKPSMTKVSHLSSLVIWQSCRICQQQQEHLNQLHTDKTNTINYNLILISHH